MQAGFHTGLKSRLVPADGESSAAVVRNCWDPRRFFVTVANSCRVAIRKPIVSEPAFVPNWNIVSLLARFKAARTFRFGIETPPRTALSPPHATSINCLKPFFDFPR